MKPKLPYNYSRLYFAQRLRQRLYEKEKLEHELRELELKKKEIELEIENERRKINFN